MRKILKDLVEGNISIEKCENLLKANDIMELEEVAKFDSSREERTGFPEAVLAESKTYPDLVKIIQKYYETWFESFNDEKINLKHSAEQSEKNTIDNLIITRLSSERYEKLLNDLDYLIKKGLKFDYNSKANILIIYEKELKSINPELGKIGIITAGTSDIAIAEESKVVIEQGGCEVLASYDIGVAGIHRLFPQIAKMIEEGVNAIIVCAGMEGALPSVVAGLIDIPVIAVPTSIGYGIGAGGKAALYSMLQSCAPGLAVVNIDNGFGAGVYALTIAKTIAKAKY